MNLLFFGKADCKSANICTDASALDLSLRISKEYWNTELIHLETRSAERINADRSLNRNFVIRFAWNYPILSILIPYLVKSREKNPTTASPNTATKLNLVQTRYFLTIASIMKAIFGQNWLWDMNLKVSSWNNQGKIYKSKPNQDFHVLYCLCFCLFASHQWQLILQVNVNLNLNVKYILASTNRWGHITW